MTTNLTDLLNSKYLPVVIMALIVLIPATLSAFKVMIRKFKKKYRPDIRNMFLKRHQKGQVEKP
jgi:DMSO/TMAO reductase YedYZ heme-binding membrane subunit